MAVVVFRDTMQWTVYDDNEGSLLSFMCFILRHSVLLNQFRRNEHFKKEKLYLTGMVLTFNNQYYMQSSHPKQPK